MPPMITVIGCDGGPLPERAVRALAAARCVAGSERHLAGVALPTEVDRIPIGRPEGAAHTSSATDARSAADDSAATHASSAADTGSAVKDSAATHASSAVKESAATHASSAADTGSADTGSAGTGIAVTGAATHASSTPSAFEAALAAIVSHPGPVAVLASGDPGFFGIVRALSARGAAPEVIPAISSVAVAFARLGIPWDDALVLSAHGRDARPVLAAALGCGKAAILTAPGPTAGPQRFIPALLAAGRSVHVAECLGGPDERLSRVAAGPLPGFADPNIVIAFDGSAGGRGWMAGHQGAPAGWALPAAAFSHRDSMITKAEVRALVLARLGPGPGRTIWDIGSGSGSVAIECARFGAHAIAIEADPAQCARIRANAAAHGVRVQLREGSAPGAFAGLIGADAVFAGGGGDAALAAAAAAHPARVVVALASVDRVRGVRDLLAGHGYLVEGTALQASRLATLPGGSIRLAAANPVFVLWGNLP
jgi:precorrin-6B C5,15-methyltransferase / cobalt-precorrin-6B C5,C15-methyltransferase